MNILKTTFLLTALTLLLLFLGQMWGGESGMIIALIMAGIMNLGSYWFSDKIALAMYGARKVTEADAPRLYSVTRQVARKAQLPLPKIYIIPEMTPNAFATGRNPQHATVAVTEGILKMLNDEELEGVMAHELAHVGNRDILISSVVATIAGAISYLANMAQWAAMFGSSRDSEEEGRNPIVMIVMALVAPIAAMLVQMAISRSREYQADEKGAKISGKPLSLASALKKLHMGVVATPMEANAATAHMFIVNPLTRGSFMSLFSTHPPMEERIKRLEELSREIS